MLDRILLSVQEPSADHLTTYFGLFLAMAFIGYFIYSTFLDKPKLHSEQLLLGDLVDASADSVHKDAAFHKQLDQAGPFAREPTGILTAEATLKLKRVITEKGFKDFMDRREELIQERITYLKTQQ
jgi:hypothetical protein